MAVSKNYPKLVEAFNSHGNTFHCFKVLIYVHLICISLKTMFRRNFDENNRRTIDGQSWFNSYFSKSELIVSENFILSKTKLNFIVVD